MLPDYVRMLQAGLLVPNQTLRLVGDTGGVLVFEAGRGFGQAMAKQAMAQGILFAGNPDSVYKQVMEFYDKVGGFGHR